MDTLVNQYNNYHLIILSYVHIRIQASCTKLPNWHDIEFNKRYWQQTTNSYGNFYLYKAYLDVRAKNPLGPSVRILSMIEPRNRTMKIKPDQRKWEGIKMQCQLWFPNREPVIISEVNFPYKHSFDYLKTEGEIYLLTFRLLM